MKKLAGILCLGALTTGAFAQGLVSFNNSAATLVTSGSPGSTASISGAAGSYYFGLLTSASGAAGTFTFAGNYATNSGVAAGRFLGGTQTVNGWAPGTTVFYEVAGWSSSLGATWNPAWLLGNFTTPGFFGISSSASGAAGGGNPPAPTLPLFGGTGITSGFNLAPVGVPEPSSMALAGLGAAALLIFRRRK
jgi:hypothetical protein